MGFSLVPWALRYLLQPSIDSLDEIDVRFIVFKHI